MNITYSKPIAGQPLEIEVKVGNRWAFLVVLLNGEKLFEKRFTCPDPPCHERVVIELKPDSKGKHLLLEGNDPDGPRTWKSIVE